MGGNVKLNLPKSKSMKVARYVVLDGESYKICRYNHNIRHFEEWLRVSSFGHGSWMEWVVVSKPLKWISLKDNNITWEEL